MDEGFGPAAYQFTGSVSFRVSDAPASSEGQKFPGFCVAIRDSGGASWVVRKRYCDFQALNMNLQQAIPHFRLSLPPVRIAFNQNDKVIMDIQKQRVQMYLDRLAQEPACMASELVWEFFQPKSQRNLWESLSCREKHPHLTAGMRFASVPVGLLERAAQSALEFDVGSPMSTLSAISMGPALTQDVVSPSAVFSPTSALHQHTNSIDTLSTYSLSSFDTAALTTPAGSHMSHMSLSQEGPLMEERESQMPTQPSQQRRMLWRLSSFGREPLPDILSSSELTRD